MGVHSATLAGDVMPTDYEPFDWEREGNDPWRGKRRSGGNGTYVNHFEFNEVIGNLEDKLYALHQKLEEIDDRLLDTRAKRVAVDVVSSGVIRIGAIVLGVLVALVLTNFIHVSNPFS
jgi:hypothetical protein